MNRFESKYFNTASLMDEALLILLEKKEFDYITVNEICKQAGVNRSTFYLHYESTNDLLEECIENMNKNFFNSFDETYKDALNKIKSGGLEELNFITPKYLVPYLNYVKENTKIYKVAISKPHLMKSYEKFEQLYESIINPILDRFNLDNNKRKYVVNFYMKGIEAIINEWIKNDCKDDIDLIVNLLMELIKKHD